MNPKPLSPFHLLCAATLSLTLTQCATRPAAPVVEAKPVARSEPLAAGVSAYQEGRFADAIRHLRLAQDQGLSKPDRIRAGKHLAFAYCVSGNETGCREEFRKLLELQPGFELEPAEAGHPLWGPVFRSVKANQGKGKK